MNYREVSVAIVNLKMDKANPRHPNLDNQVEIIDWMINGNNRTGQKLYALAKDVIKYGINPAERIVITKESNDKDYTVLEGNRRVTTIKLLNNPDIAPNELWKKKFKAILSKSYSPIRELSCIYYPNPEDAYHFIEIKHMGEANGAGIVQWDSEQKARHAKRLNKKKGPQRALELLEHVRTSELYDKETKDAAHSGFPITTLDRMISDVEFRDFLGLGINSEGRVVYSIDPEEARKPISKIIKDFGSGLMNVRDVINKEMREKYKSEFSSEAIPDLRKRLVDPICIEGCLEMNEPAKRPPRYQLPANRKYVILPGINIPIDPTRFNRQKRIYDELRKLPLKDRNGNTCFPNAAVLLIRVFLETSIDTYIDAIGLQSPNLNNGWKDISLVEKIKFVLKDIESKGKIDAGKAKVIKKMYSDPNRLYYPGSLNDYVHNRFQLASPSEIVDFWDSYQELFISIYTSM